MDYHWVRGKVSQSQAPQLRNSQNHVRWYDEHETPLVPWWKTILVGNIKEFMVNVMFKSDSDLEDVEEAIKQNEWITRPFGWSFSIHRKHLVRQTAICCPYIQGYGLDRHWPQTSYIPFGDMLPVLGWEWLYGWSTTGVVTPLLISSSLSPPMSPSEKAPEVSCPEDTIALLPRRRSQLPSSIQAPSQNTYKGRSICLNIILPPAPEKAYFMRDCIHRKSRSTFHQLLNFVCHDICNHLIHSTFVLCKFIECSPWCSHFNDLTLE